MARVWRMRWGWEGVHEIEGPGLMHCIQPRSPEIVAIYGEVVGDRGIAPAAKKVHLWDPQPVEEGVDDRREKGPFLCGFPPGQGICF